MMQDCRGCHQEIKNGGFKEQYSEDELKKWHKSITHFYLVPELTNLHLRLRRDWFISFLQKPHTVRPRLESFMPKLDISQNDAEKLAEYFYAKDPESNNQQLIHTGSAERGEKIFEQKECGSCHNSGSGDQELLAAQMMAPDLSLSNQRMEDWQLALWLRNPQAINPKSLMPKFVLSEQEIADLVRYIKSLQRKSEHCLDNIKPDLLSRKVFFKEIEEKIFKKTCWHCHANPAPMKGDGGPGNTGGFGYPGKGLDFSSFERVQRGKVNSRGTRESILKKGSTGVPIVLEHILQRHREIQCSDYSGTLGMPLGLPALDQEQIDLLYTWIEQGAKED